jgi:hypothetical protein
MEITFFVYVKGWEVGNENAWNLNQKKQLNPRKKNYNWNRNYKRQEE